MYQFYGIILNTEERFASEFHQSFILMVAPEEKSGISEVSRIHHLWTINDNKKTKHEQRRDIWTMNLQNVVVTHHIVSVGTKNNLKVSDVLSANRKKI